MSSSFTVSVSALLLGLLSGASSTVGAAPVATIAEGDSIVIRGASRFAVTEGLRFLPDDLVEATSKSRLLRIEFDDGLMLLAAPGTRLWLDPRFRSEHANRAEGGPRSARFYLLSGTVKLTAKPGTNQVVSPLATPWLDIDTAGSSIVITLTDNKLAVFAEAGDARLTERSPGKSGATQAGASVMLRSGEYYARIGSARSSVASRPDGDFIQHLPRAFLDTLPPRAALFAGRSPVPKPMGEFSYTDAEPWIDSEATLRPAFVTRWKSLATQTTFRQPLAADMRAHPEWDRVLYPEKYLPKPKPKPPPSPPRTTDPRP